MRQELLRQAIHVATALVFVGCWMLIPAWAVIALLIVFIAYGIYIVRTRTPFAQFLLKNLERDHAGFPGKGAFLFVGGALLTAIVFPGQFIPALLVVGLADSASTIIGRTVRSPRIFKTGKTLAGTIAFLIIAAAILSFYSSWWWLIALLVAGVELIPLPKDSLLDDNWIIPLITAALLVLL